MSQLVPYNPLVGRMSLALIFLRGVVHFAQIRMAVKRVAIDGHFGVQAM